MEYDTAGTAKYKYHVLSSVGDTVKYVNVTS